VIGTCFLIISTQSDNILQKSVRIDQRNDHEEFGNCYTQLTDVEQEVNGVYTYDRKLKFNDERLKKFFGAPAAIEKSNN
jgi:hypothetical protein